MKGKWIYIAFASFLGTMAAYFNFYMGAIFFSLFYLVWLSMKESRQIKLLVICAVAIGVFALVFKWTDDHNNSNLTGAENQFEGVIKTIPEIDGDRLSFIYELLSKEKLYISYKIKTIEEKKRLKSLGIGMRCKLTGELKIPNKARNFYAFDFQKYLYYKHIHWVLNPDSLNSSQCLPSPSLKFILQKWRTSQLLYIKNHFPENTVGMVQALIFGDRNEISVSVEKNFQDFGLVHLLAISGSHVGLIIAITFYIFIRIGISRERTFLIIFITLPGYMVLTGGTPSVIRACLIAMLVMVSIKLKTKFSPLDALSVVFLLMVLVNPYYVTDLGFQLSFLVSFSLILSSASIISLYESPIYQLLIVTTIAQLSSLPIILFYNFEISLLSLPLNVIYVPLISFIILPLSFLSYFFFPLFEPLGEILTVILSKILDYSITFLEWFETFSFFSLILGKPAIWLVIVYYVVIFYLFICWEERKQVIKDGKPLFLMLLVIFYQWFSPYFSNEGTITMVDVGQGDSILIELPFRKAVYLIDTGGMVTFNQAKWKKRKNSYNVGEDIITPLLKAKGIRTINKLILTHDDFDHIGGSLDLITNFKVEEVIIGTGNNEGYQRKGLYQTINKKNIPIKSVKMGDYWENGKFQFYILGPNGKEESKNNRSVVLYTKIGGFRWLFTGDLEEEGEKRIIKQFPRLDIDVLKVGHHGSKTSTSKFFVEQITPKIALISVGTNNRFGHPHPNVTKLLTDHNIEILRTDQHGSICYKFIENKGTFQRIIP